MSFLGDQLVEITCVGELHVATSLNNKTRKFHVFYIFWRLHAKIFHFISVNSVRNKAFLHKVWCTFFKKLIFTQFKKSKILKKGKYRYIFFALIHTGLLFLRTFFQQEVLLHWSLQSFLVPVAFCTAQCKLSRRHSSQNERS